MSLDSTAVQGNKDFKGSKAREANKGRRLGFYSSHVASMHYQCLSQSRRPDTLRSFKTQPTSLHVQSEPVWAVPPRCCGCGGSGTIEKSESKLTHS